MRYEHISKAFKYDFESIMNLWFCLLKQGLFKDIGFRFVLDTFYTIFHDYNVVICFHWVLP